MAGIATVLNQKIEMLSRNLYLTLLLTIFSLPLGSCRTIEIAPALTIEEKRALTVLLHEIMVTDDSSSKAIIFFSKNCLDLPRKDYESLSSDRLLVRPGSKHISGEYPAKVVLTMLVFEGSNARAIYWIIFDGFFNRLYHAILSKEKLNWTVESISVY